MSVQKRSLILAAAILCLICAIALCACDKKGGSADKREEREYALYMDEIVYDADSRAMCAIISFKGEEEQKLNGKLNWKSCVYPLNAMYLKQDVTMTVCPDGLFAEVNGRLSDEDRVRDGIEYNVLKVALRYDTIYKSITSDADIKKAGNRYLHTFGLDESESEQSFSLSRKTQNSAGWYTVLITATLALAVLLTAVYLLIKGRLWQKTKK